MGWMDGWMDGWICCGRCVKDVAVGLVLVAACLPGEEPAHGMDGWMDLLVKNHGWMDLLWSLCQGCGRWSGAGGCVSADNRRQCAGSTRRENGTQTADGESTTLRQLLSQRY